MPAGINWPGAQLLREVQAAAEWLAAQMEIYGKQLSAPLRERALELHALAVLWAGNDTAYHRQLVRGAAEEVAELRDLVAAEGHVRLLGTASVLVDLATCAARNALREEHRQHAVECARAVL